jgi:biotin carboxyl carrier protein
MPKYRVYINGNEYSVDVLNAHERPVRALVNGEIVEVHVEEDESSIVPIAQKNVTLSQINDTPPSPPKHSQISTSSPAIGSKGTISSPLPGIIVSISVNEGDRVEIGQELCVLEAMKMNNPIRATINGTVTNIFITIGQQVQHGLPLMTVEG